MLVQSSTYQPVSPKVCKIVVCWWNLHNYAGEQAGGTEEPTEPKLMADGNEMQIFSLHSDIGTRPTCVHTIKGMVSGSASCWEASGALKAVREQIREERGRKHQ